MYVYADRSKLQARSRYIVTACDGNKVKLRRFTSQLIGGKEYDSNLQEIYKVPSHDNVHIPTDDESSDEENAVTVGDRVEEETKTDASTEDTGDESGGDVSDFSDLDDDAYDVQDATFVPPERLSPQPHRMDRERRPTKKVDRYGEWAN